MVFMYVFNQSKINNNNNSNNNNNDQYKES